MPCFLRLSAQLIFAYNATTSGGNAYPAAESGGVLKDAIFDDVLALKQPSAMWPRPVAVGVPNARGNVLRQRRLRCACLNKRCTAHSAETALCYLLLSLRYVLSHTV